MVRATLWQSSRLGLGVPRSGALLIFEVRGGPNHDVSADTTAVSGPPHCHARAPRRATIQFVARAIAPHDRLTRTARGLVWGENTVRIDIGALPPSWLIMRLHSNPETRPFWTSALTSTTGPLTKALLVGTIRRMIRNNRAIISGGHSATSASPSTTHSPEGTLPDDTNIYLEEGGDAAMWAGRSGIFSWYAPPTSQQRAGLAPPPDEVVVECSICRDYGLYGGRNHPTASGYFIVSAHEARRLMLPPHSCFAIDAELPRIVNCHTCGARCATPVDGRCAHCTVRASRTLATMVNGGRRFGIELEFGLPPGAEYDPDDDDEYEDDEVIISDDINVVASRDGRCQCSSCIAVYGPLGGSTGRVVRERRSVLLDMPTIAGYLTEAGVPCEAPGYTHQINEGCWKLVPDSSVYNGYELVSPPMQWESAQEQVRLACETLQQLGCRPTDQCGLHVHHDVGDLSPETARMLARNWDVCQSHSNRLVSSRRVDGQWCEEPSQHIIREMCQFEGDALHDFFCIDGERYRPLNWTCWHNYGTVEVRMHESTLDADEILAWVAYTQSIIDTSLRCSEITPPSDFDDLIDHKLTIRQAARPARVRQMLRAKAAQRAR